MILQRRVHMWYTRQPSLIDLLVLAILVIGATIGLPDSARGQVALYGGTMKEHSVRPGEEVEGSIRLKNFGSDPAPVRLYQTDYHFTAAGENQFAEAGTLERSNASWISVRPRRLVLAPGEEVAVSYRILVPGSPAADGLTGSYWSIIMVEVRGDAVSVAPEADRGLALGTHLRYGVQVATHIAGSGTRSLDFSQQALTEENDERHLRVRIENTGTLASRPEMSLEIYDHEGRHVKSAVEQRGLLYPGTSMEQRFDLSDLDDGLYQALVLADPGRGDVLAGRYRLDISR